MQLLGRWCTKSWDSSHKKTAERILSTVLWAVCCPINNARDQPSDVLSVMMISTRWLRERPALVSLVAMGRRLP